MKVHLFSVYDSKVEVYSSPLPFKHPGEAMRWMIDQVKRTDSNMAKYSSDFTLFQIGTFDDATCEVVMLEARTPLGNGLDFVAMASS